MATTRASDAVRVTVIVSPDAGRAKNAPLPVTHRRGTRLTAQRSGRAAIHHRADRDGRRIDGRKDARNGRKHDEIAGGVRRNDAQIDRFGRDAAASNGAALRLASRPSICHRSAGQCAGRDDECPRQRAVRSTGRRRPDLGRLPVDLVRPRVLPADDQRRGGVFVAQRHQPITTYIVRVPAVVRPSYSVCVTCRMMALETKPHEWTSSVLA